MRQNAAGFQICLCNGRTYKPNIGVTVKLDTPEDALLEAAMKHQTIERYLEGKQIGKKVYVKNRILNLLVRVEKKARAPFPIPHKPLDFKPTAS